MIGAPDVEEPTVAESIIEQRLRVVTEFREDERPWLVETLEAKLERRLSRWEAEQVELELSVKERDTSSQKTVLECWIAGESKRFVGTSGETDLNKAVVEVRDDVHRQVNDHVEKLTQRGRR